MAFESVDPARTDRMLLHSAGPSGLTSAALSRALFGEDDHLVTVRAEVSRLRRIIGEFILGNPYRLSSEVTVSVSTG